MEKQKDICYICGEICVIDDNAGEYNFRCTCGEQHWVSRTVCTRCTDSIQYCDSCEMWVHTDDVAPQEDFGDICADCDTDENDCDDCEYSPDREANIRCRWCAGHREHHNIVNASQNPTFHMQKEAHEKYCFGFELEVEMLEKSHKCAEQGVLQTIKYLKKVKKTDYAAFKHDGSLQNGYEIVTQPYARSALNQHFNWHDFLKNLAKTEHSSFESGNCGLHIHVSKVFTSRQLQKIGWTTWHLRELLARFSERRGRYDFCHWEPIMCGSENTGKYYALRMQTGKKTIEFRFPRGTLNFKRFLATYQCIDAIIQFALQHSYSLLKPTRKGGTHDSQYALKRTAYVQKLFLNFIKYQGYAQHFYKYLTEHSLAVHEPHAIFADTLFAGLKAFYARHASPKMKEVIKAAKKERKPRKKAPVDASNIVLAVPTTTTVAPITFAQLLETPTMYDGRITL
jgi:hypothetical protein